jgi:hypothetical protein
MFLSFYLNQKYFTEILHPLNGQIVLQTTQ